ncbi:MAG: trigger factor [Eubacteriales bacterium]|nr:trigger factor [Eubacteriales bacterium]
MNKKFALLTLSLCAATFITGCGDDSSSNYSKYVKLADYKNIEADRVITTITDEDVQDEIQNNLALSADYIEISDRAAQEGDDVIFDLTTVVDGEELADSSGEDFELELGSDMMIEGFEEEIIGMETGDTKEFTLTFPTPYDGELDGKEGTFTVTVKTIYEVSVPEYNDEYVSEISESEFSNTADYEASLKETLQETANEDSQNMACESALQTVIEASTFDGYPEELFTSTRETIESENQEFAEALGLTDISELYGEDFDIDDYVSDMVNEKIVVYAIAEKEKLNVTDEEYNASLSDLLVEYEYDSLDDLKNDIDEESYKYDLLYQKVLDFLGQNCTFNDIDAEEYYSEDEALFLDDEDMEEVSLDEDTDEEDVDAENSDMEDADTEEFLAETDATDETPETTAE